MKKSFTLVLAATAASLLAGCSIGPTVTYPIFPAESTTRPTELFDTGYIYEQGLGTPRDYDKAIKYYTLAAKEKKDGRALNNLGVMAVQGRGSSASTSKGLSYFRKAAAEGSAAAHYNIGLLYDAGFGVSRSAIKAVAEYRMAAEMGHGHAQARLAEMLRNGDGAPVDEAEAHRLSEMAAARGIGYPTGRPTDLAKVQSKLAQEHCVECSTPEHKKGAARQFTGLKEMAAAGDAVAQYNLGVSHLKGDSAVLDPSEAARLFTVSARQGYAPAQRQLAQMHLRGQAIAKSKVLAHAWLNLASKGSDDEAATARDEMAGLEVSMSSDEIREAQEIAESGYLKGR
jgi:FOG: TPR repeat, SEL1 subfamily